VAISETRAARAVETSFRQLRFERRMWSGVPAGEGKLRQMKPIRLVDVAADNESIRNTVESALDAIHREAAYVAGPNVAAFETDFANYLGVRHVVGVGSGTDALRLALLAIGVGPGDEVIVSPMAFLGVAEAIVQLGARPAFVDINPATCSISVDAVRDYLLRARFGTINGPKAIVPTHLYGIPAPMEQLLTVAETYGLRVVEDACQAHGARAMIGGRRACAGAIGAAGCFSFYPDKNLGAWGDAGAVATNDPDLAARVASLRDHGRISNYAHQECGYNSRLDTLQAAVLSAKLARLEAGNRRRRELAATYDQLLEHCGSGIMRLAVPVADEPCYHRYVIRSDRRDALRNALLLNGIECGIHYPVPLHLQPALRSYGYRSGDFPSSEQVADTVLSLPMHPHLIRDDLERVVEALDLGLTEAFSLLAGGHHHTAAAWSPPTRGQ
jgi:dTDP-4-amino-4,6-dideoxygalactose transaminase